MQFTLWRMECLWFDRSTRSNIDLDMIARTVCVNSIFRVMYKMFVRFKTCSQMTKYWRITSLNERMNYAHGLTPLTLFKNRVWNISQTAPNVTVGSGSGLGLGWESKRAHKKGRKCITGVPCTTISIRTCYHTHWSVHHHYYHTRYKIPLHRFLYAIKSSAKLTPDLIGLLNLPVYMVPVHQ